MTSPEPRQSSRVVKTYSGRGCRNHAAHMIVFEILYSWDLKIPQDGAIQKCVRGRSKNIKLEIEVCAFFSSSSAAAAKNFFVKYFSRFSMDEIIVSC